MEPLDFHGSVTDGYQTTLKVRPLALLDADMFESTGECGSLCRRLLCHLRAVVAWPVLQVLDLLQACLILCSSQNLLWRCKSYKQTYLDKINNSIVFEYII